MFCKSLRSVAAGVCVMGLLTVSPLKAYSVDTIKIFIDDKQLYCEVPPVIMNDITMVPLRAISEGLGMKVDWNDENREVIIYEKNAIVPVFQPKTEYTKNSDIKISLNGERLDTGLPPVIINGRTLVPLRAVSEGLGMDVQWDGQRREVIIKSPNYVTPPVDSSNQVDYTLTIRGDAMASSQQLRTLLKQNNPQAPDLIDLYLEIGRIYGIRGDIAFCQAAKETGWWKFGGLVLPEQNNYCGLGATGAAATGWEDLHGADPMQVSYKAGIHGAIFKNPAAGVEAHIQHLYAYSTKDPLPAGRKIVDPRFTLVNRGCATYWQDLNGRWAVPGNGYGQSILSDYYQKALAIVSK